MTKKNRERLFQLFQKNINNLIYLKGGESAYRYGTDFEYPFRQESNFLYLTGVQEPGFHVIFDLSDQTWLLVLPRRGASYAVWHGYVLSENYYYEHFKPSRCIYDDQLESYFARRSPDVVYCLNGEVPQYFSKYSFQINTETLPEAMAYCRSVKSDAELDKMRTASNLASEAHIASMKAVKPGMMEYEVKAVFDYENIKKGALHAPYNGIFASGKSSAILHYVDNNRQIKDGDLLLIDAGSEFQGYAADITRTFPANGTFSKDQAELYDIALQALNEAIAGTRPGVKMEDLHLHAATVITEGLKSAGYLRGSVQDMMKENVFALFFPHGLGHFLGLDTHDVGGYLKGTDKIDRPGLEFLRARRTLDEGMVITIEPGIYFIPALLHPAFENKSQKDFLCINKIKEMMHFGGIRIEDNLIVTKDGSENLTKVPKSRKDIEAAMK